MFTLLMLSKNPSLDKEYENFNVQEMFLVQTHYVMLFASTM